MNGASGATGYLTEEKEVAPMKRVLLLMAVAAMMAAMMIGTGPAFAQGDTGGGGHSDIGPRCLASLGSILRSDAFYEILVKH